MDTFYIVAAILIAGFMIQKAINKNTQMIADSIEQAKNGTATSTPDMQDEDDEFYDEATEIVTSTGKASASLLQKHLDIGYARAARLIDRMETEGIVGHASGDSKPRKVLK